MELKAVCNFARWPPNLKGEPLEAPQRHRRKLTHLESAKLTSQLQWRKIAGACGHARLEEPVHAIPKSR
eukprot:6241998-Amphidinium_carterae.1